MANNILIRFRFRFFVPDSTVLNSHCFFSNNMYGTGQICHTFTSPGGKNRGFFVLMMIDIPKAEAGKLPFSATSNAIHCNVHVVIHHPVHTGRIHYSVHEQVISENYVCNEHLLHTIRGQ